MPPLFQRQEELPPGLMQRVGNAATAARYALFGYPGVGQVEQALNPDPQVTNRASMLPIGNYDDGSVGLAWPQSLIDAKEAFGRFHRGEAPQPQDAVLAGLAMAGSGFGGLGARALESGAARFAANPKEAAPAGMVAASAGERQGIRAYHGSPHDFDRFEASKLGTGEGNQAYGNGLYFAEAEDVARTYRDSLAGQGNAPQGRMYEVNINANPDQFLDWNKPLSEQSDAVRAALEPIARAEAENELRRIEASRRMTDIRQRQMGIEPKPSPPLPTVEEYMQRMQGNQFVGNENALRDAGIPGMRYLDGFSRETGQGTTNYVVFPGNENLIDIMRKYSNPKEAAPAGLLATSNLDRMKAAESAPARSIPDAPQSMPELQGMIDSNLDRFAVSRSVGDQAFSQDPARYNAYAYGLQDVMNPDSEWMLNSPTLQSGGLVPFGTSSPGLMQPPAQPDAPGLMAQQRPSDRLQERGYLDKVPPAVVTQDAMGDDQIKAYENYIRSRVETMNAMGVPYWEARRLIEEMPDATSYRQRLTQESLQDPKMQDEIRNLLERLR